MVQCAAIRALRLARGESARERANARWRMDDNMLGAFAGIAGGLTNPVVFDFTSGSNATCTAPAGAQNVVVEAWGAGGGGSHGVGSGCASDDGNGGGSGAYCRSTFAIVGGQTILYTVGQGGAGEPSGSSAQNNGGDSGCASGTLTIAGMLATGGRGGVPSSAGTGGAASGGNQANTAGGAGTISNGGNAVTGLNGNSAGAGGRAGFGVTQSGKDGAVGRVIFTFT